LGEIGAPGVQSHDQRAGFIAGTRHEKSRLGSSIQLGCESDFVLFVHSKILFQKVMKYTIFQ
jgi:hypothetical protein